MRTLLLSVFLCAAPASAQLGTWEAAPSLPCGVSDLAPARAGATLLAATSCGAFRLDGDTWARLGDLDGYVTVGQAPDGDVFALSGNRVLRFDGAVWSVVRDWSGGPEPSALAVTDAGEVLRTTTSFNFPHLAGLFASADDGQSWSAIVTGMSFDGVWAAGAVRAAAGYDCFDFPCVASVYLSAGSGWQLAESFWAPGEYYGSVYDVTVTESGTIVVAVRSSGGNLRRSTDGGVTWASVWPDAESTIPSVIHTDAGIVAALEYTEPPSLTGLLVSTDDGASFSSLPSTLDGRRPRALVTGTDGRLYAVAQATPSGPGIVMRTVGIVSGESGPQPVAALRVGPNPASGDLRIAGATAEVEVLDVQGRVVRRAPAGASRIGLAGLAPGVYVVRAGDQSVRVVVGR